MHQISSTRKVRVNALSHYAVLVALLDGATRDDIAKESGVAASTLRNYLAAMHKPRTGQNLIYICGWAKDIRGERTVAIFKWGPGKSDAPRLRMTSAERSRRYRQRKVEREALFWGKAA